MWKPVPSRAMGSLGLCRGWGGSRQTDTPELRLELQILKTRVQKHFPQSSL